MPNDTPAQNITHIILTGICTPFYGHHRPWGAWLASKLTDYLDDNARVHITNGASKKRLDTELNRYPTAKYVMHIGTKPLCRTLQARVLAHTPHFYDVVVKKDKTVLYHGGMETTFAWEPGMRIEKEYLGFTNWPSEVGQALARDMALLGN